MLITSRDSGRWVIPKEWPMAKKKPHQVARQEAWEEAGVRGRVRKQPFGSYRYAKKVSREGVLDCLVEVFLLIVSDIAEDFRKEANAASSACRHGMRPKRSRSPSSAGSWAICR